MHVGPQVVGHVEGDDLAPRPLGEVVELAVRHVVAVDEDVLVPVRPGLLVPEADGVPHLVGDRPVLWGAMQHGYIE